MLVAGESEKKKGGKRTGTLSVFNIPRYRPDQSRYSRTSLDLLLSVNLAEEFRICIPFFIQEKSIKKKDVETLKKDR